MIEENNNTLLARIDERVANITVDIKEIRNQMETLNGTVKTNTSDIATNKASIKSVWWVLGASLTVIMIVIGIIEMVK